MPLGDLIDQLWGTSRTLRVYGPDPVPALSAYFESTDVTVEHVTLAAAEGSEFVTVHENDVFRGGASLDAVRDLLDPTVSEPWDGDRRQAAYRSALDPLADLTFEGLDRRQLLAVTREIEDRAWRFDDGELLAAFQAWESFGPQRSVYDQLGNRDGLAVHVYVPGAGESSSLEGVTVHEVDPAALGDVWFVAYVGNDPAGGSAILAEQRGGGGDASASSGDESDRAGPRERRVSGVEPGESRGFVGVWTDDRDRVAATVDAVRALGD